MNINKKYWIGVASKEHVLIGQASGFAQFCHGKLSPAKRLNQGDGLIYYSGREKFNENVLCQKFTAIGYVLDDKPHKVEQYPGFFPYRRKIQYMQSNDVEIKPLIENLSFIKNKKYWGMSFRYGFFEICYADFMLISKKMTDLS